MNEYVALVDDFVDLEEHAPRMARKQVALRMQERCSMLHSLRSVPKLAILYPG